MTHPHDNPPQLNIDVDHHNIDVDCQGAWVEGGGIGKIKCTGRAVYAVRLHLIDHCNRPGLDAGGNKIIFCCRRCVTITAQRVQLMINLRLTANRLACVSSIHRISTARSAALLL